MCSGVELCCFTWMNERGEGEEGKRWRRGSRYKRGRSLRRRIKTPAALSLCLYNTQLIRTLAKKEKSCINYLVLSLATQCHLHQPASPTGAYRAFRGFREWKAG